MEFKPPKVKKLHRFRPERWVPYPESLKNVSNYIGSNAVVGQYNGSNVVIDDPELSLAIYNLGCFGKGSLSRGEPSYYLRMSDNIQKASLPETNDNEINPNNGIVSDNTETISDNSAPIVQEHIGTNTNEDELNSDKDGDKEKNLQVEDDKDESSKMVAEEFQLEETLHLNLEEAYFLCYALGCLQVVDLFDKKLSLEEAWELFCESQDDFVQKYVVYHHFRSKGWVVKPGLKFGGDFILYKWGVNITHASYIVIIEVIRQDGTISEDHQQASIWSKLTSLARVAETAGKEVMLCRVIWPQDVLFKDVHSPEDIRKFGVNELLSKRWVSSQAREILDKEEIG